MEKIVGDDSFHGKLKQFIESLYRLSKTHLSIEKEAIHITLGVLESSRQRGDLLYVSLILTVIERDFISLFF